MQRPFCPGSSGEEVPHTNRHAAAQRATPLNEAVTTLIHLLPHLASRAAAACCSCCATGMYGASAGPPADVCGSTVLPYGRAGSNCCVGGCSPLCSAMCGLEGCCISTLEIARSDASCCIGCAEIDGAELARRSVVPACNDDKHAFAVGLTFRVTGLVLSCGRCRLQLILAIWSYSF